MPGKRIMEIQMSKRISNLFTSGHHIIMSEMVSLINTLQFSARQAITTTECKPLLSFDIIKNLVFRCILSNLSLHYSMPLETRIMRRCFWDIISKRVMVRESPQRRSLKRLARGLHLWWFRPKRLLSQRSKFLDVVGCRVRHAQFDGFLIFEEMRRPVIYDRRTILNRKVCNLLTLLRLGWEHWANNFEIS